MVCKGTCHRYKAKKPAFMDDTMQVRNGAQCVRFSLIGMANTVRVVDMFSEQNPKAHRLETD